MIVQGTRRGSKKTRGTEGGQSRGQLAGTFLEMSYLHHAAALQPQPGTAFSQPGTVPVPTPQQRESNGRLREGEAPRGHGLRWTTLTGKETPTAAGAFSDQSHAYPRNDHNCCWRTLVKLLEGAGRKRLWVAAISQQGSCRAGQSAQRTKYR